MKGNICYSYYQIALKASVTHCTWKATQGMVPREQAWRANHHMELIYADLCVPMKNESIAGIKYFMLLMMIVQG